MTQFGNIGQFGNLTTQTGRKLTFKDFDLDGDNKISNVELKSVLQANELDTVELSTVDTNKDKTINEEEFAIWEQKIEMEKAVKDFQGVVSYEFGGASNSDKIAIIMDELKSYINEFAADYAGKVKNMASDFQKTLSNKYAEIKDNINKEEFLDKTLGEVLDDILDDWRLGSYNLSSQNLQDLGNALAEKARAFTFNSKDIPSKYELKNFLKDALYDKDSEIMKKDIKAYNKAYGKLGSYLDNKDFAKLKEMATALVTSALANGVEVNLDGSTIKSTKDLNAVLGSFTDPMDLSKAVNELINSWDDSNLIDKVKSKSDMETLKDVPTEEFSVKLNEQYGWGNTTTIDGWYYYDSSSLYSYSRTSLENEAEDFLNTKVRNEATKQLTGMLNGYGINFKTIETFFNAAFNEAKAETLANEALYQNGQVNILDLTNNFLYNFNTNIQTIIEEFNKPAETPVDDTETEVVTKTVTTTETVVTTTEVTEDGETVVTKTTKTTTTTTKEVTEGDNDNDADDIDGSRAADDGNVALNNLKNEVERGINSLKKDLYATYQSKLGTLDDLRAFSITFMSTKNTTLASIKDTETSAKDIIQGFQVDFIKNLEIALDFISDN